MDEQNDYEISDIESSEISNENTTIDLTKEQHVCQVVCATIDFLRSVKIVTDVICPIGECEELFSHQSALNFHMEKVHKVKQERTTNELILTRTKSKQQREIDNCKCKYYCPMPKCKYFQGSKQHLPTFHSLKNHFIRIHGEKIHECSKCKSKFAIKSEMHRHQESCGRIFNCLTCGCPYSTMNSLIKHAKNKQHAIPVREVKSLSSPPRSPSSQPSTSASASSAYLSRQEIEKKPSRSIKPKLTDSKSSLSSSSTTSMTQQQSSVLIGLPFNSMANSSLISTTPSSQLLFLPFTASFSGGFGNDAQESRSFGCQANIQNVTQEMACQTNSNIHKNNSFNDQFNIGTNPFIDKNLFNSISTSPLSRNNLQSQETQTLSSQIENNEDFMILNDISTQTLSTQFPSSLFLENFTVDSIGGSASIGCQTSLNQDNTAQTNTYTQTNEPRFTSSIGLMNNFDLDDIYLMDDIQNPMQTSSTSINASAETVNATTSTGTETIDTYFQTFDFMSQTQFSNNVASASQTESNYFLNNTQSIQTQTNTESLLWNNGVDTITQTDEWNLTDVFNL